jgi:hypothetical protein
MKSLLCLLLLSFTARAQEPSVYMNLFDNKVYSLKTKGVKDFVVDIKSSKLTQHINDQKIFGHVKDVTFRTYWTASPERLAIEVLGLPEGFREAKEELKLAVLSMMDSLLPPKVEQRLPGYKVSAAVKPREFLAQDSSGLAPFPSYLIRFDAQDKLSEIVGQKGLSDWQMSFNYDKRSFSDGKWVLLSSVTTTQQHGITTTLTRQLNYGSHKGIGVLTGVAVTTEQRLPQAEAKPMQISEELLFTNYQLDTGEALKYFLGEGKPAP